MNFGNMTSAHFIFIPVVLFAGAVVVLIRGLARRDQSSLLVLMALSGLLVLPAYAFFEGHPFRMRYMVAPSVGACVFVGAAARVAAPHRQRHRRL